MFVPAAGEEVRPRGSRHFICVEISRSAVPFEVYNIRTPIRSDLACTSARHAVSIAKGTQEGVLLSALEGHAPVTALVRCLSTFAR
jgi:hypothetical protein